MANSPNVVESPEERSRRLQQEKDKLRRLYAQGTATPAELRRLNEVNRALGALFQQQLGQLSATRRPATSAQALTRDVVAQVLRPGQLAQAGFQKGDTPRKDDNERRYRLQSYEAFLKTGQYDRAANMLGYIRELDGARYTPRITPELQAHLAQKNPELLVTALEARARTQAERQVAKTPHQQDNDRRYRQQSYRDFTQKGQYDRATHMLGYIYELDGPEYLPALSKGMQEYLVQHGQEKVLDTVSSIRGRLQAERGHEPPAPQYTLPATPIFSLNDLMKFPSASKQPSVIPTVEERKQVLRQWLANAPKPSPMDNPREEMYRKAYVAAQKTVDEKTRSSGNLESIANTLVYPFAGSTEDRGFADLRQQVATAKPKTLQEYIDQKVLQTVVAERQAEALEHMEMADPTHSPFERGWERARNGVVAIPSIVNGMVINPANTINEAISPNNAMIPHYKGYQNGPESLRNTGELVGEAIPYLGGEGLGILGGKLVIKYGPKTIKILRGANEVREFSPAVQKTIKQGAGGFGVGLHSGLKEGVEDGDTGWKLFGRTITTGLTDVGLGKLAGKADARIDHISNRAARTGATLLSSGTKKVAEGKVDLAVSALSGHQQSPEEVRERAQSDLLNGLLIEPLVSALLKHQVFNTPLSAAHTARTPVTSHAESIGTSAPARRPTAPQTAGPSRAPVTNVRASKGVRRRRYPRLGRHH